MVARRIVSLSLLAICLIVLSTNATTLLVPSQYPTIEAGFVVNGESLAEVSATIALIKKYLQ